MDKIEQYYDNTLTEAERRVFEEELKTNPALAEEVAFWVQARAAAQAEAHARRKAEFAELRQSLQKTKQRSRWYTYAAAASVVLAIGLGWWWIDASFLGMTKNSGMTKINKEWAAVYVEKNLTTLSTQMGSGTDSLQMGINAFNSGDLIKAKAIFDALLARDSRNAEAQKYAGIVAIRRQDYDQAIKHFHALGLRTDLVANPGKFYEALALLQRDLPLDKKAAENLLQEIKAAKLDGWKEVE